jgi:hypothetical protein
MATGSWRSEVSELFSAVILHSSSSFSFSTNSAPIEVPRTGENQSTTPMQALLALLASEIYASCYCRRLGGQSKNCEDDDFHSDDITERLSSANLGKGRWDGGWVVQEAEPSGRIWAKRRGCKHWFWPGQYLVEGSETTTLVGAVVSVYLAKEDLQIQPGFYFAMSESVPEESDHALLVRLYWNVKAGGAAALISLLTERLNRFRIPFRIKCPRYRRHFDRRDSAVLFIPRWCFPLGMRLATECYGQIRSYLLPDTPLFSKVLMPGLGFAENPENGESFGVSRSRLLAEAIARAYRRNLQTPDARFEELASLFRRMGVDPDQPYLCAGSRDDYEVMPNVSGENP